MKNNDMNLKGNKVTGAVLEVTDADYTSFKDAAAGRLLESARCAPEGTGLAFKIRLAAEGEVICMIMGDAGAEMEDYKWIFGSDISLKEADPGLISWESEGEVFSYTFRADREEDGYGLEDIGALYEALMRTGAVISLHLDKKEGREVVCRARMDLKRPASLMVRTLLGSHFVRMEAVRVPEEAADADERISPACAGRFIRMILGLAEEKALEDFRREKEKVVPEEDLTGEPQEADSSAEFVGAEWSGNIEDMELSVRAYNSLKRAGYSTYDEIKNLTDEELYQIRNLGRKSADQVREKIEEFRLRPIRRKDMPEKKDYGAMLDGLIGLSSVKAQVRRIRAMARMNRDMQEKGMEPLPISLHMGFLGNPGTAKTTAARIMAGILYEAGFLQSDQILEVGRGDLIGKYEGQTAQKVQQVFSYAEGRLLFIDEAYSLLEHWEGAYGDEAINTIVQEMENRRNSTVVVFAGYPEEMEDFFQRNPGLKSRVPYMIRFDDYGPEELLAITRQEAEKRGFGLSEDAEGRIREICSSFMKDKGFGNGRFCRNLVENALLSYAERFYGGECCKEAGTKFMLSGKDFIAPEGKENRRERRIGFY